MITKETEFHEVEVKFLIRKGSHGTETIKELVKNVLNGIGGNEMDGIETEDIEIYIDGKKRN